MVSNAYDLGVEVKKINDEQLYKARGFSTFKAFAEQMLPFSRETAYALVKISEKFTREQYMELGYSKLRSIATVEDASVREELVNQARTGNLERKDVDKAVREAKGTTTSTKASKSAAKPATVDVIPPSDDRLLTLLARVQNKPIKINFRRAKTDGGSKADDVLETVGEIDSYDPNCYALLKLSDDIHMHLALRVEPRGSDGKLNIVGLTGKFERVLPVETSKKGKVEV
jgi:hypothetical protein